MMLYKYPPGFIAPDPPEPEREFYPIHNRLYLAEVEPCTDGRRRWEIHGREEYDRGSGDAAEMRQLAELILRVIPAPD